MNLALTYQRSAPRYLAARAATATRLGSRLSGAVASSVAPLSLLEAPDPQLPGEDWTRVTPALSGICGSDLSLLSGRSSTYLAPLTSTPFVPGHEVVGSTVDELPGLPAGTRVVIDPVLACAARGVAACPSCRAGRPSRCDHVTTGRLSPGLQTGFCADTGGGWARRMLAHRSQLYPVPDALPDERAVLVEPLACAVHAARRAAVPPGASVLVVGAGTVGLLTLLALRALTGAGEVNVLAKHAHQATRARALGATAVLEPSRALRSLRRTTGAMLLEPERDDDFLLGGVDVALECTGGSTGLGTALRSVAAGGTVVLSGLPSGPVDLTPLWYRELRLVGAYASGSPVSSPDREAPAGDAKSDDFAVTMAKSDDFAEAMALAAAEPLEGFVDAAYSLRRWRDALEHAAAAGRAGAVKVAFAPGRG